MSFGFGKTVNGGSGSGSSAKPKTGRFGFGQTIPEYKKPEPAPAAETPARAQASTPATGKRAVSAAEIIPSNLKDSSGRPFAAYHDIAGKKSVLDKSRVAPEGFDPFVPQVFTAPKNASTTNEREPYLRQKYGQGLTKDQELDHKTSLQLLGSNDPSNLGPVALRPNGKQQFVDEENRLGSEVRGGKKSMYDAQRELAAIKGQPLPGPELSSRMPQKETAADRTLNGGAGFLSKGISAVFKGASALKQELTDILSPVKNNPIFPRQAQELVKAGLAITRKVSPQAGEAIDALDGAAKQAVQPVVDKVKPYTAPELIKSGLNTKAGRAALSVIQQTTSNIPIDVAAQTEALFTEKTLPETLKAWHAARNNPDNPEWKKVLYDLQDSGVQSALGTALAIGLTAVTKSPAVGQSAAMSYYAAISAAGQQREKGEVYSLTNVGIDTIGDMMLSNAVESILRHPAELAGKQALRTIAGGATKGLFVEGSTEVSQSWLKFANDYADAQDDAERAAIVDKAKRYVLDGSMAREFVVAGISGGLQGGAAASANVLGAQLDANPSLQPPVGAAAASYEEAIGGSVQQPDDDITETVLDSALRLYRASVENNEAAGAATALHGVDTVLSSPQGQRVAQARVEAAAARGFLPGGQIEGTAQVYGPENPTGRLVVLTEGRTKQNTRVYDVPVEDIQVYVGGPENEIIARADTLARLAKTAAVEGSREQESGMQRLQRLKDEEKKQRLVEQRLNTAVTGEPIELIGYAGIKSRDSGFRAAQREVAEGYMKDRDGELRSFTETFRNPYVAPNSTVLLNDLIASGTLSPEDQARAEQLKAEFEDHIDKFRGTWNNDPVVREADRFIRGILTGLGYDAVVYPQAGEWQSFETAAKNMDRTQKERVAAEVEQGPKSIKEVADATGILEPNVRRILGVGAKDGTFERVDQGVYVLKRKGQEIAYIEAGEAQDVLARMADEGKKFDMVFLDPAYFSRALIGGNRGIKAYEFIMPEDFAKVMDSVSKLVKDDSTHVYLMLSGAKTAQADMQKYADAALEAGFRPVGEGSYTKLTKDGKPVTNVRGKQAAAERVILLTQSGKARKGEVPAELDFRFIRPSIAKSYATEKAPELMRALIRQSTLEGEAVLDPFAGSGVTGAEAVKAGRTATLVEKKADIVPNQVSILRKTVDKWQKRIEGGERPYVLVQYDSYTNDLRVLDGHHRLKAYQQAGFTEVPVILDETSRGKINPELIDDLHDSLQDAYMEAPYQGDEDASEREDRIEETLDDIYNELFNAEPGTRWSGINEATGERIFGRDASPSPSWIPEDLRSSELFAKVLPSLTSVDDIEFPSGNRPKQRALYNEILAELDRRLGVDTSEARNDILAAYGDITPQTRPTAEAAADRGAARSEAADLPESVDDLFLGRGDTPKARARRAELGSAGKIKSINGLVAEAPAAGAVQQPGRGFKLSDRAKAIVEEFGASVAERELPTRLLGRFRPTDNKVRVQALYDLTTVVHEATHAIDEKHGIYEPIVQPSGYAKSGAPIYPASTLKVRRELTRLYTDLYPNARETHPLRKRVREGIASLVENYFYSPAVVQEQYPALVEAFIKPGGKYYHEDITRLLDMAAEVVEDYAKLTPAERIGTRIRTGREVVDRDKGFTFRQRAVFEVFNKFEPLQRAARTAGRTETWDDPTVQAFNLMNKNTVIYNWIKGGSTPVLMADGNWRIEQGSMADYAKLIQGREGQFEQYLVARRVLAMHNKLAAIRNKLQAYAGVDLRSLDKAQAEQVQALGDAYQRLLSTIEADDFSLQDATATVKEYGDTFAEPAKQYDAINARLLDFAAENGLMSRVQAEEWKQEEGYASFRRWINDNLDSDAGGTVSTSNRTKVGSFKARTGSKLDIVSPIYNQRLAVQEVIGKAMENRLWERVANLAKQNGEVRARFEKLDTVTIVDPKTGMMSYPQERDPNVIRIFKDGKREFYKAAPEFLAVAKVLRPAEIGAFGQALQIPTSVFTRLTTSANPFFALGNLTVDQVSAITQTKTGFTPIVDPAKSLVAWIRGNEEFVKYLAVGGERQTLSALYDLSPEELAVKLEGPKGGVEKARKVADSVLGVLETPSNISELMTRFGEFKRSVDRGEPTSVAMYRAAEVTTPFGLSGNLGGAVGQKTVRYIPYLNAIIQVSYKFGRTAKNNPARVATVGAALLAAALTSAIAAMKYSTDEQRRLLGARSAKDLARYIYIPSSNGTGLIRIRIPEQFGAITGLAYLWAIGHYGGNKAAFDNYLDVALSAIPDQINIARPKQLALSWIPQYAAPSIMVSTNTKDYPEILPIVPQSMQDLPPEEQYTEYTSRVAKWLGQVTGASPMLIDYWITNQFGAASNFLLGRTPSNPLYISEGDYVLSGRAYNGFYDGKTVAEQRYQTAKLHPDQFSEDEVERIKATRKLYNDVGSYLKDAKTVSRDGELPESIKQRTYELINLLSDGGTDEEVRDLLDPLREEVDTMLPDDE